MLKKRHRTSKCLQYKKKSLRVHVRKFMQKKFLNSHDVSAWKSGKKFICIITKKSATHKYALLGHLLNYQKNKQQSKDIILINHFTIKDFKPGIDSITMYTSHSYFARSHWSIQSCYVFVAKMSVKFS